MTILDEVYTAGGGDAILNTIELSCTAWANSIVLVSDFVEHDIVTEDLRLLTALPSGMAIALPKRDASGAQNLTFAIDGVRTEATNRLRSAMAAQAVINLTYRAYLASDLNEPADAPYYFVVRSFSARSNHVEVTAGLFDLIDMRWPRMLYNSITAPGLKYL